MKILQGYPRDVGAKKEVVADIAGSADYTTVVTLGQIIYAKDFGLKFFEFIECTMSDDALYRVQANLWAEENGGLPTLAYLGWFNTVLGTEVADHTDLHASFVRVRVVGL